MFLILPFWSAVPAAVVWPAAATAVLKPPVAVSACSLSCAAAAMMARSEAATPARLFWLIWRVLVRGGEGMGEGVR